MGKNKCIYMPKWYIHDEKLKKYKYIKEDLDEEILGRIWRNFDFEKAEEKLFEWQCILTRYTFRKNNKEIKRIQDIIVHSTPAKMLAVRKIAEISKSAAGVDGIVWRKDSDKMKAVINLNNGEYKAKPLKQFILRENFSSKERQIGVPCVFDRAMQVLYFYALEPIAEATADRKSFAFRKGRSSEQAHAFIMNCLTDVDAPEWILITDITSFYDTISHKWLLDNIPMDKKILKEFLNAGFILNGEFFSREEGISLGNNLSTLLGNMVLDGLQKRLFDLQGKKVKDYKNGFCLRFADDACITARTEKDAENFKKEVIKFVTERGLKISEKKTKIVNIKEGFEFLSRFYWKADGVIKCVPSEKAVHKFETEVEEMIYQSIGKWSQSKLIQSLNAKITGFTTYHKCEDSLETFKHLDVVINALLLKAMKELHGDYTKKQIVKKYWKIDSMGRYVFTLTNNKEKCIKNLADTIPIKEYSIDSSKNIFFNREYFEELEKSKEIQNCVGRYKKVWERQEGRCYICSKEIRKEQQKDIIFKRESKDKTIRNIAYVHTYCKNSIMEYVDIEDENVASLKIMEVLSQLDNDNTKTTKQESKFVNLIAYFHNLRKNTVKLTFKDIEKILNFKLCDLAYKYRSYFFNQERGEISEAWLSQGFKIANINMKEQKIEFERYDFRRTKIIIPKFMYRVDLPSEMIEETNRFFLHLQEKYRINMR